MKSNLQKVMEQNRTGYPFRFGMTLCVLLMAFFVSFCKEKSLVRAGSIYVDKDVKGIGQIANTTTNAFQLFSHGRPGELLINGEWKNAQKIAEFLIMNYEGLAAQLGITNYELRMTNDELGINHYSPQRRPPFTHSQFTHLNIYGCNFGQGTKGLAAVAYLEKTLGISVAASDDVTGRDGDWTLEVGQPVGAIAISGYDGNLQWTCNSTNYTASNIVKSGPTTQGGAGTIVSTADIKSGTTLMMTATMTGEANKEFWNTNGSLAGVDATLGNGWLNYPQNYPSSPMNLTYQITKKTSASGIQFDFSTNGARNFDVNADSVQYNFDASLYNVTWKLFGAGIIVKDASGNTVNVGDPVVSGMKYWTNAPSFLPTGTVPRDAAVIHFETKRVIAVGETIGFGYTEISNGGPLQVESPMIFFKDCIATSICAAGTTAPAIIETTASNACPATTVNLATMTNTGTQPAGTTLVWSTHNPPTTSADTLTNLTVSTSGKYYVFYYDKVNNCYSPADSVTVTITSPCSVCNAGTTAMTLSATTASNTCPTTTANISGLVSSACPAGSSIRWYSSSTNFTTTTHLTDSTKAGAGTYYPVCYDAVNNCYSPAPTTGVTVTISTCGSSINLTNICPATTINLTTATSLVGTLPVGTTLTWHNGTPATDANKIDPTKAGAGTYYAAFYDGSGTVGCYSPTTQSIIVTIVDCCAAGTAAPTFIKN